VRLRAMLVAGLAAAILAGVAPDARAQTFGIGARMVSVSGAESPAVDASDPSNTRFAGGLVRLHASKRFAIEASMDFQSTTNSAETARISNTPIQVSALLLPIRTKLAPYFLVGVGWYKHKVQALDNGKTVATAQTTDFGYHTGLGGQIMFGRHVGVFVDYRRTWVDANGIDGSRESFQSVSSVTSVVTTLASLYTGNTKGSGVTRSGSMWTGGMAIYF